MTKENSRKLEAIFQDSEFLEKFSLSKNREEAINLLASYGIEVTEDDLDDIATSIEKAINIVEGKEELSKSMLSDKELDMVTGGTIPPMAIAMCIRTALPIVIEGIKNLINLFKG